MRRRAFVALLGTLTLAGCGSSEPELYPSEAAEATPPKPASASKPAPKPEAGGQVALLLPLTGPNPGLAAAMLHAARLAMDVPGAPGLDVRDTGGTPAGAAKAAQAATAAGDRMILGPLTAAETAAVAATPVGLPVLAFTSDPQLARPGVWTLGLTPGQQVRRLVGAAVGKGKTRLAGLLPDNDFGRLMAAELAAATRAAGAPTPRIRLYADNTAAMNDQARDIAAYADRQAAAGEHARNAAAGAQPTPPEHAPEAPQRLPPPPFDALLVAASGPRLAELAAALDHAEVDPAQVQLLGPALWAQPAARSGGKFLDGAWYAAPDPAARAPFEARYRAKYGGAPPNLADLAYDAAAIARLVHAQGSLAVLTRPDGFAGVDGLLALLPDGHVRRALAVFEIRNGSPRLLEPPPPSVATGA